MGMPGINPLDTIKQQQRLEATFNKVQRNLEIKSFIEKHHSDNVASCSLMDRLSYNPQKAPPS